MAQTLKCFNCGDESHSIVWSQKPPLHKKRICDKLGCWQAWWKLSGKEAA